MSADALPDQGGRRLQMQDEDGRWWTSDEDYDRLRAENEALKAEALDVCGITYGMLTAGIVDDHDRIMRACNKLAEFARRLTGEAPPLPKCSLPADETERSA